MTPAFLVKRLRKIRDDAAQSVRDVEWWNANRTDAPPMGCEVERVIVAIADKGLAAAARGDHGGYSRVASELAEYAERAIGGVGA